MTGTKRAIVNRPAPSERMSSIPARRSSMNPYRLAETSRSSSAALIGRLRKLHSNASTPMT